VALDCLQYHSLPLNSPLDRQSDLAGRCDFGEPNALQTLLSNKIRSHRDWLALADFTLRVPWRPVRSIKEFLH
jgi:hypothetical protein